MTKPQHATPLLDRLRTASLVIALAGAAGSVALMLRAGRNTPRFLLPLFVIWILAPFVALGWANKVSKRWSDRTRATLYGVTLVIALASFAIYGEIISRPAGSARGFSFVAGPPASLLLAAIAVGIAALVSRSRSRRYDAV